MLTASMLLDPAVLQNPYDFYAALRGQAPVWVVPGTDVVAISSFALRNRGIRDSSNQSNGNRMVVRSSGTTDAGVQAVNGDHQGQLRPDGLGIRYRLDVVTPSILEVVAGAGGWLFDRVMAGWDVTVFIADDADTRPLRILGTQTLGLEYAFASPDDRPRPHALAVATNLLGSDLRARQRVRKALDHSLTEVTLWGEVRSAEFSARTDPVEHRLSDAARVFKAQALAAAGAPNASVGCTETFRSRLLACPSVADLVPASGQL
jgi:hypothetical protein